MITQIVGGLIGSPLGRLEDGGAQEGAALGDGSVQDSPWLAG